jgi:hypothetical protein
MALGWDISTQAAQQPEHNQIRTAYLAGRMVSFDLAPPSPGTRGLQIGPWYFGERLSNPNPRDKRLNLYLVAPGTQHHAPGHEDYDHNDVINAMPVNGGAPVEWDVYWAVVLDPSLDLEIRSERQLIMATQREFRPGDLFEFDDIPGAAFLKHVLKMDSMAGLAKYRRKRSGNLPQVLIVPAGFAVRASVSDLPGEEAGQQAKPASATARDVPQR